MPRRGVHQALGLMPSLPTADVKNTLRFTSRQLFFELAMHHHNYIVTQQLRERELPGQTSEDQARYFRTVVSHNYAMLALTLCKVMEFHGAFRHYLPDQLRDELDAINSRVARSRILNYRNKFVGHLFDVRTKKPLEPGDIVSYWEALLEGQSEDEFRHWWWSTRQESDLKSVAGLMIRISDSVE